MFLSDPHHRLPVLFILKPIISLCASYLLKVTSKIKPTPVGLCYTNDGYQQSGTSLYCLTPSFSKFKQFNWPELMLPIKFHQFKMCQLVVQTKRKIKLRPVGLLYVIQMVLIGDWEHHFTTQHQVSPTLNSSIGLN